ncbi:MAG: hypothetical protein AAF416_14360 [Pseudomonadota bacterium]
MTLLELLQRASDESGMGGRAVFTTAQSLTGRQADIVNWVKRAWRRLQNEHDDWFWMRGEYSGSVASDTRRYASSALGDAGLTSRFADWIFSPDERQPSGVTIYLTATGQTDERPLIWRDWDWFWRYRMTGEHALVSDYPVEFTISPGREIVLYPTPNDAYTLRGQFHRSPQELTLDSDEPEMPVRFHDLVWMGALHYWGTSAESLQQTAVWRADYNDLLADLRRDQLPRIDTAQALA